MDRLWSIIEKERIAVKYRNLKQEQESLLGLYFYCEMAGPIIILDNSLKDFQRIHKCVLAEEIGHFYTSPRSNYLVAYTSYASQLAMSQDERKAHQWATDFLIPDIELFKAVEDGFRSCYELAERFEVTEWFVHRKMGFLKMCFRRTGLKVRGRELFKVETIPCLYL